MRSKKNITQRLNSFSCIFCQEGRRSKEHLWGKWWKDNFYPMTEEAMLMRGTHKITKAERDGGSKFVSGIFVNAGAPLSTTTIVVCRNCNNTWMNGIETKMKSAFERNFLDPLQPFSVDDVEAIRNWLYLKFCLHDFAFLTDLFDLENIGEVAQYIHDKENKKLKRSQWDKFYKIRRAPSDHHFFVAASGPDHAYGYFQFLRLPEIKTLINNEKFSIRDTVTENMYQYEQHQTCTLSVGAFTGIVTNDDGLAEYLRSDEFCKGQATPFVEMILNNPVGQIQNCILVSDVKSLLHTYYYSVGHPLLPDLEETPVNIVVDTDRGTRAHPKLQGFKLGGV